ncbi:Protein kinase alk2 [Cryptotrichosporon argae]
MLKGSKVIFPALLKSVVAPPVLVACILYLCPPVHIVVRAVVYFVVFPALLVLRSTYSLHQSRRAALGAGAREIPRVQGRHVLNIDVLLDWAKSGSEDEVGWMMAVMRARYGPTYNTRVLGEDQIISMDPAVLNHVLVDDFDNFVKGAKFKERAQGFLGDGIFNSDGDRWRFHRSLTRPFFHPSHVNPAHVAPRVHAFLAALPASPFDAQERLGELVMQIAVDWMCGPVSGWGEQWEAARRGLGAALRDAQMVVGKRVKIGTIWALFEIGQDPLAKPMSTLRTFFRPVIEHAIERKRERQTGTAIEDADELHLIDRLVEATDDYKLIEDQLINALLASRDTTSALLTFCVYMMTIDPDAYSRLREEVLATAPNADVDKDVIREQRITRAFINEVLRLFPPVPLNIRRTLRPALLPSSDGGPPMFMPANTSIILATVLMQRSSDVFGADADAFNLDRWLDGGLPRGQREAFMSWNVGPRMCLGQPLALTVAHTFLTQWVHHMGHSRTQSRLATEAQPAGTRMPAEWATPHGQGRARGGRDRVWIVADVVLAVKGGLWIEIERAEQ